MLFTASLHFYTWCIGYLNSTQFLISCKCTSYCIGDLIFFRLLINCSLSLHSDKALSLFGTFWAGGRVGIGVCDIFPFADFIQVYRALYKTFHDSVCWGSNWGDDNHSGSFSGQYDLRGRDDPLSTASTLNAFNNITSRRDDPRNFEWDTFIWRIHTVTSANTHRKMCDLRK